MSDYNSIFVKLRPNLKNYTNQQPEKEVKNNTLMQEFVSIYESDI